MSRKTQTYLVTDEGRDKGKTFVITEMAARPGHRWACRALFALMNAGVTVPDGIENAGMAGLASVGLQALGKIPFDVAEPLTDELLTCVEFVGDPSKPNIRRPLFEGDFEEIATIFKIQKEVLSLHIEPFISGAKSISGLAPTPASEA